jgi:zinc transport system substrate-binding protein
MRQVTGREIMKFLSFCFMMLLLPAGLAGNQVNFTIYVGIEPAAYAVERITDDDSRFDIQVLLTPGKSPAAYDPSPRDIAGLSKADVYFLTGLPFERKLTDKAARIVPNLNIVDTRRGIMLRRMEDFESGGDRSHQHEQNLDPHFWLDPLLVKIQARTICEQLKKLDPNKADRYKKNLVAFEAELDRTDSVISEMLAPYKGSSICVFHPAYGYFADRYGLKQVAIESAGKEPGAKRLIELTEQARKDGIRAILLQRQFSTKPAEAIAQEIGAEVVVVDPLARDYINNLLSLARAVRDALQAPE